MLIPVSWRNIWRNKVRSLVIITAIALGITAGVFSTAFMKGMMDKRIDTAIQTEISHIQIHDSLFRKTSEMKYIIPDVSSLTDSIRAIPHVVGVSPRIVIQSMVSSAETGAGVKISGIYPDEEKQVTNIFEKITNGKYFEGIKRNPVVIGEKLAKKLNVHVRSKVVITLQDMDRNLTAGAFRVAGIYKTANSAFDESNIYVRFDDLAALIDLPKDACHEIAIRLDNNESTLAVQHKIKTIVPSLEVLNWKEISPEMSYITEVMDMYMYIFIIIILLALLFGIINTMLMVVLERTKEIGMLMAIGMSKLKIFSMVILETVMLSLTGGISGVILGTLISKYFETHVIDMSMWSEGYAQLGYDSMINTSLDTNMLITVTIMVVITGIIAAIYPAWKALRNDPADALRME
ncbi:MAG: ABC transporter permease [Chlorobi bacterium]|nr:ABC transporter permease [Chlorobiota bacterium]